MFKFIQCTLAGVVMSCAQLAMADCYVLVNSCRPEIGITVGVLFRDSDGGAKAQLDPHQCAQRARDYLNYCAGPLTQSGQAYASAYYYANRAWKSAVVVTVNSSQSYVADSNTYWIPVQKDY